MLARVEAVDYILGFGKKLLGECILRGHHLFVLTYVARLTPCAARNSAVSCRPDGEPIS